MVDFDAEYDASHDSRSPSFDREKKAARAAFLDGALSQLRESSDALGALPSGQSFRGGRPGGAPGRRASAMAVTVGDVSLLSGKVVKKDVLEAVSQLTGDQEARVMSLVESMESDFESSNDPQDPGFLPRLRRARRQFIMDAISRVRAEDKEAAASAAVAAPTLSAAAPPSSSAPLSSGAALAAPISSQSSPPARNVGFEIQPSGQARSATTDFPLTQSVNEVVNGVAKDAISANHRHTEFSSASKPGLRRASTNAVPSSNSSKTIAPVNRPSSASAQSGTTEVPTDKVTAVKQAMKALKKEDRRVLIQLNREFERDYDLSHDIHSPNFMADKEAAVLVFVMDSIKRLSSAANKNDVNESAPAEEVAVVKVAEEPQLQPQVGSDSRKQSVREPVMPALDRQGFSSHKAQPNASHNDYESNSDKVDSTRPIFQSRNIQGMRDQTLQRESVPPVSAAALIETIKSMPANERQALKLLLGEIIGEPSALMSMHNTSNPQSLSPSKGAPASTQFDYDDNRSPRVLIAPGLSPIYVTPAEPIQSPASPDVPLDSSKKMMVPIYEKSFKKREGESAREMLDRYKKSQFFKVSAEADVSTYDSVPYRANQNQVFDMALTQQRIRAAIERHPAYLSQHSADVTHTRNGENGNVFPSPDSYFNKNKIDLHHPTPPVVDNPTSVHITLQKPRLGASPIKRGRVLMESTAPPALSRRSDNAQLVTAQVSSRAFPDVSRAGNSAIAEKYSSFPTPLSERQMRLPAASALMMGGQLPAEDLQSPALVYNNSDIVAAHLPRQSPKPARGSADNTSMHKILSEGGRIVSHADLSAPRAPPGRGTRAKVGPAGSVSYLDQLRHRELESKKQVVAEVSEPAVNSMIRRDNLEESRSNWESGSGPQEHRVSPTNGKNKVVYIQPNHEVHKLYVDRLEQSERGNQNIEYGGDVQFRSELSPRGSPVQVFVSSPTDNMEAFVNTFESKRLRRVQAILDELKGTRKA
jgi:hypothetical protein